MNSRGIRLLRRVTLAAVAVLVAFVLWMQLGVAEIFDDEKFNSKISILLANELPCVAMNDVEKTQAALVVKVLSNPASWQVHEAAVRLFGQPQVRDLDRPSFKLLCRDNDIDAAVSAIALRQKLFDDLFLDPDVLHLASMLGPRDPAIANGVGKTAFLPRAPNYMPGDVRPLARLVLGCVPIA